jgi:DNA-directed RNA polymerase specialized sigma24 family protein
MASGLNAPSFQRLLAHLDADPARAGERYEDLRRTLLRFFEWRGAPFPEDHTDETFDRVARRLSEGVAIANLGGYCYTVARLIYLETLKGPQSLRSDLDSMPAAPASHDTQAAADTELRLACLDRCLAALAADQREVILTYYRDEKRARIDSRRDLAARLGINAEALANRAQRLRDKLERCVNACLDRTAT